MGPTSRSEGTLRATLCSCPVLVHMSTHRMPKEQRLTPVRRKAPETPRTPAAAGTSRTEMSSNRQSDFIFRRPADDPRVTWHMLWAGCSLARLVTRPPMSDLYVEPPTLEMTTENKKVLPLTQMGQIGSCTFTPRQTLVTGRPQDGTRAECAKGILRTSQGACLRMSRESTDIRGRAPGWFSRQLATLVAEVNVCLTGISVVETRHRTILPSTARALRRSRAS